MLKKYMFIIAVVIGFTAVPSMLNASQPPQKISAAMIARMAATIAAAAQPAISQAASSNAPGFPEQLATQQLSMPTETNSPRHTRARNADDAPAAQQAASSSAAETATVRTLAQEPYPIGLIFPTDMATITPEEDRLLSAAHPLMSHIGISEVLALLRVSKGVRSYMQFIIRGDPVIHNTLVRFRETYDQPITIRPNLDDASNFDIFAQQLHAQLKAELSGKAGSRINIDLNGIEDLSLVAPDAFAHFVHTIHRAIADNNCFLVGFYANGIFLEKLDPSIFAGMHDLEEIDLCENTIDSLSDDVFKGLTKLKYLWLFQVRGDPAADGPASRSQTALSPKAPGMLDGLANLRKLDLAEFGLYGELPATMFDGLKKLETLDLHFNSVAAIQPRVFQNLRKLRVLNLGLVFDKIETGLVLYNDSFRNLSELNSLSLSGCNLTELPPEIFSELKRLENLDLNENAFSSFPTRALRSATNLQRLAINRCPFEELPENALLDLPKLKSLDLSRCFLRHLSANLFQNNTQLEKLDLSSNKLTELPDDIFRNLSQLKMLNITENNFATEPLDALVSLPATCSINEPDSDVAITKELNEKFSTAISPRYAYHV